MRRTQSHLARNDRGTSAGSNGWISGKAIQEGVTRMAAVTINARSALLTPRAAKRNDRGPWRTAIIEMFRTKRDVYLPLTCRCPFP